MISVKGVRLSSVASKRMRFRWMWRTTQWVSFAGASCSTILLLDLLGVLRHLMPSCSSFQIFRDCIKVQAVAIGFSPTPVASIQPFLLAIRLLVFACIFFFQTWSFTCFASYSWKLLRRVFPKELQPILTFHFIYTTSPTFFPSPTSSTSSTSTLCTSHSSSTSSTGAPCLHISYKTPTMLFARELHRSSYTKVITQELLHRSYYVS
jgi:hypothetical protein